MRSFGRISKGSSRPLYRLFGADAGAASNINKANFDISDKQLVGRSVYMDLGSTTPIDFRVMDTMLPFMTENYGNPHSR
jgi:selenocysteine lyase/cysteine desulfurase